MNNMRRGFTMIELIFVIVIIGILAAVAIPKLAATRDDARISNVIANTRTALGDMTSYYMAQGNDTWKTAIVNDVTSVSLSTDATCSTAVTTTDTIAGDIFYLCDEKGGADCISFTTDVNGTSVTIAATATAAESVICDGVMGDPAIIGITGGIGKSVVHRLGGAGVKR